ncbi:MAG: glycosyl transferase [Acidithiobacillales bacterium SM1_46]|nr:MAG: glycosyl transferase [Acidithiobacillales bacterium SM1_46]
MEALFWAAFGFIVYTYAGYPLGVWMLSRLRPETGGNTPGIRRWPSVTVVVAVHNEQGRVLPKLSNLRALDYELGLLRIMFVSDGSTDATNEHLAMEADVTLLSYPERRGKPHALNIELAQIDSEVVVFTDVRQELEPGAVRCLVARLLEPGIGAVSGELVHRDPVSHTASHIGLYWRYEKWIRKAESRLASTVGVTGALYAIRRRDYVPLPTDTLLDDFVLPMQIVRRGQRVIFEPRAVIYDELQTDTRGERKRKVRTLTGNFQAFVRNSWLFVPGQNPVLVQFLSHKVFRLFVPYAMVALLAASFFASGAVYRVAAAGQVVFYLVVLLGLAAPSFRSNRFVSFALVFVELNWAAVLAMRNFLTGGIDARWEKT